MKSSISLSLAAALLLCCPIPANSQSCAKDMFFDQLESPRESINTGLKYWIQLRRKNAARLVDNLVDFTAGDEIRIQIVPNIAGYAYVVLEKGTSGQKKVLFPNTYEPDGKVLPGRQYLLPAKGYLKFDKTAGTETIRVILSRHPLAESALLHDVQANTIVSARTSSAGEPLQNDNCLLAFSQAENKKVDFEAGEGKGISEFSKDLNYVPGQSRSGKAPKSRLRASKHHVLRIAAKPAKRAEPAKRSGSVTVINIEPEQNLIAEIQLKHI